MATEPGLHPLTKVVNKHFFPVYDKPMIYYSLSILLLFKIENITIVCNPEDELSFIKLLGYGDEFGVNISYRKQETTRRNSPWNTKRIE